MKKIYCSVIFFIGSLCVFSQNNITLSFTGRDSLTQKTLALDSIYIKNVTADCDTVISDDETQLTIEVISPLGVDELNTNRFGRFILNQNYPNPFERSTTVNIYREYSGPLKLILFDGLGRKIADYENDFDKGLHSFKISVSGYGVLLLSVSDTKNNKSIKIISNQKGQSDHAIQYLGQIPDVERQTLKSRNYSGFIFYGGQLLNFSLFADGYIPKIIVDSPTTDTTYIVNMSILSIPSVTTLPVTDISLTTATSGGEITSDGGYTVNARGICISKTNLPTIEDSVTMDGSGSGSFSSNLSGLSANTLYFVRAYATNTLGTAYGNEVSFTTSYGSSCGASITINHRAGIVAPADKLVTYGTVTNIPGETSKCWITSNLGADHQAASVDDASEASAGWYWQFNRKQGYKHDGTYYTPNTTWISSISENSDWSPINDPCTSELGAGWRIPTKTEYTNVKTGGNWTNWADSWNSGLKLHGAGFLGFYGALGYRGSSGNYWSSTQYNATSCSCLVFGAGYISSNANDGKAGGYSIRCLSEVSSSSSIPTVITASGIVFTENSATSGGVVTSDGGAAVTARGVCWSTLSNPDINDFHTSDSSGIGGFISNLTGLHANTPYFVRAYATNSKGTAYGNEVGFTTLSGFTCGSSITINHLAGNVAPVTKTVTYSTVTNIPGETSKCWITSNLGADHQATTVDDATEASAGWYWQFNRKQGFKYDGTARTPNTTWITPIDENLDWQVLNDPCNLEMGNGWRIPTLTEWANVISGNNWTKWDDPWKSELKLHAAGYLSYSDGSVTNRGTGGYYRSTAQFTSIYGQVLNFFTGFASGIGFYIDKSYGFSLRCIQE